MSDDKAIIPTTIDERPPPRAMTLFGTDNPVDVVAAATGVANALKGVLTAKRLTMKIGGRGEHVLYEGWSLLGSLCGVFPVTKWTKPIMSADGKEHVGWEARVEAVTRNGEVVGAAEAECLYSERNWNGRDSYALRSMAQTRAASKALRQPLGFIVTLAGYEATPADEMPHDEPRGRQTPCDAAAEMGAAFDEADVQHFIDRIKAAKTVEEIDATEGEASAHIKSAEGRQRIHKAAGARRAQFKRDEKKPEAKPAKPKGDAKLRDALLLSLDKARTIDDVKACYEEIRKHSWSKDDGERLMDRVSFRKSDFENAA